MHVVRHEHVRVQPTSEHIAELVEHAEVDAIVLPRQEAGTSVVAALNDVKGQASDLQTGATWHGKSLSMPKERIKL